MHKKRKLWTWLICIVMMCSVMIPSLIYADNKVPNNIRVGLRSSYENVSSVEIKNTQLSVGYEKGRFIPVATLQSSNGFVIGATMPQYYTGNDIFITYNDAVDMIDVYKKNGIDAVPAYIAPDIWKIYFLQDQGNMTKVQDLGYSISVQDGAGQILLVCEPGTYTPQFAGIDSSNPFAVTKLAKGTYRGAFEFLRKGDKLTAVNIVDFEDYLYGVVPSEMPASWEMEALKAQAVTARSTAVYQYNKYVKNGYNVCDTTMTQVYKGLNGEHARTNQAVDETRGEVAVYNGRVAETLFYSTSGGYTEDPKYVWGNSIPYLQSVPDPYETEPAMKPWTRTITLDDINLCLEKRNINIGKAKGIRINEYTPAGRVNELQIIGTNGIHTITKEDIRTFFSYTKEGSLRSRMFTLTDAVVPTTSGGQNAIAIQDSAGSVVTKNINEVQVIGADGKITTVDTSAVVQGSGQTATYGTTTSGKSSTVQEYYGDIVISGRGYGHGVGMSQSGAKGMAKAGYTYDQIIEYYYVGVKVER